MKPPKIQGRPRKTVDQPGVYVVTDRGADYVAVAGPFLTDYAAKAFQPLLEHQYGEEVFYNVRILEEDLS